MKFPKLKNGDIIITKNGEKWIIIDKYAVNQKENYTTLDDQYNVFGLTKEEDESYLDIMKVYRSELSIGFQISKFKENLIFEREETAEKIIKNFKPYDMIVLKSGQTYIIAPDGLFFSFDKGYVEPEDIKINEIQEIIPQ